VDRFEFVNIQRFQNLLRTSLNDSERKIIQQLLIEEKAKRGLSGARPNSE
jgi:uncharacterized protein YeeX (DUF496 family)